MISDFQGLTNYKVHKMIKHFPVFFVGVIFADLETSDANPLDWLKDLEWFWKIPINLLLLALVAIYGSYYGNGKCLRVNDGDCEFHRIMTINHVIPLEACVYIGAVPLILLALTSSWC